MTKGTTMMQLNERNFATEVLEATQPVLVDFYATWCGPCRMLAPVLDQLAGEFAGRIKFAKVDVDEAPELAARYQITGVPTLLLFQHGQVVDEVVGLAPLGALRARLRAVAGPAPAEPEPASARGGCCGF
jgi:thioredoxin 1